MSDSQHSDSADWTSDLHSELIERAFAEQAAAFEDPAINRIFTLDAEWMFRRLPLKETDLLLDVAAGTGHATRSLAASVRCAVAIDVTAAMLTAGKAQADAAGLDNVLFANGQATALPFLDASFNVVITRFALHHVQDPGAVIGEMARCLRPGGCLAIGDVVAVEDATIAAAQNRLERLRDPSHTRMLSIPELSDLMAAQGLVEVWSESREIDRPVSPWLAQASTEAQIADQIHAELRADLAGATETGFSPRERDSELRFVQTWASVATVKPGG